MNLTVRLHNARGMAIRSDQWAKPVHVLLEDTFRGLSRMTHHILPLRFKNKDQS